MNLITHFSVHNQQTIKRIHWIVFQTKSDKNFSISWLFQLRTKESVALNKQTLNECGWKKLINDQNEPDWNSANKPIAAFLVHFGNISSNIEINVEWSQCSQFSMQKTQSIQMEFNMLAKFVGFFHRFAQIKTFKSSEIVFNFNWIFCLGSWSNGKGSSDHQYRSIYGLPSTCHSIIDWTQSRFKSRWNGSNNCVTSIMVEYVLDFSPFHFEFRNDFNVLYFFSSYFLARGSSDWLNTQWFA